MLQLRHTEAEEQYRMQIAADPDSSLGYLSLAWALEAQGKSAEAKMAHRIAYKIDTQLD